MGLFHAIGMGGRPSRTRPAKDLRFRRVRIALYNDSLKAALGGPTAFTISLSRLLADAGHTVTLLTADAGEAPSGWNERSNPRVVSIGPLGAFGRLGRAGIERAREVLERVDAAHLSGVWVPSAAQVGVVCRSLGVGYVVSLHGTLNDWPMQQSRWTKRVYMALVGRGLLRGARAIHCTSLGERAQATPRLPRGCVTRVIFPPIALESGSGAGSPRRDGPAGILFVGRLHPVKGLETLIRALGQCTTPGVTLTIAGAGEAGYVASLKALANEAGVSDRICWAGFVEGEAKARLYAEASAFVLPSHQENFGLVLFEALAAGCPVITTRHVDTWRELQDQGNATIVESTPESIAKGIDRVLSSPEPRHAALAGQGWVRTVLSPEALGPAYSRVYGTENPSP